MVNSPLIRPYLLGGVALGGGTLDSHDEIHFHTVAEIRRSPPGMVLKPCK